MRGPIRIPQGRLPRALLVLVLALLVHVEEVGAGGPRIAPGLDGHVSAVGESYLRTAPFSSTRSSPTAAATDTLWNTEPDFQELRVKYVFWSPPKYSVGSADYRPVMGVLDRDFEWGFRKLFDKREPEYLYVKRAFQKFDIGNWLMVLPAALLLTEALISDDPLPWVVGASVLLAGDIVIGISGYHDLSRAAEMRNERILATLTVSF